MIHAPEITSTIALLTTLGWPSHALDQKGALSWACAVGQPPNRVMGAAVICRADTVVCRLRSDALDANSLPTNHLEITWAIGPEQRPVLRSVQRAGAPVEADAATALDWFKDTVNTMGTRPEFQAMGTRDRAVSSSARPRVSA